MQAIYHGLSAQQVEDNRRKYSVGNHSASSGETPYYWLKQTSIYWLICSLMLIESISLFLVMILYVFIEDLSTSYGWIVFGMIIVTILVVILSLVHKMLERQKPHKTLDTTEDKWTRVVRSGFEQKVKNNDLVVGDVILLSFGDEVPFQATILESEDLEVEEPVEGIMQRCRKSAEDIGDIDGIVQKNHLLKDSIVIRGEAVARIDEIEQPKG